ncbi:MAG: hypothetical protein DSY80_05090, partial [Desulfocapsa sp.]
MNSTPRLCLAVCFVFFLVSDGFGADQKEADTVLRARQPIIINSADLQPSWMQIWTHAREAGKNAEFKQSLKLYRELIQEKPNIEEVLSEYAHLLMETKEWENAFAVFQQLLEIDPDSQEYLLHAGQVALQVNRYSIAANYLGQVYSSNPDGKDAVAALRGQILALQKQDRKELAYPLMEQLYLLVPHEDKNIRELARYSIELKQFGKAGNYYTTLINEFKAADSDLLQAEGLFTQLKNSEMARKCQEKYLAYHPYYQPFHKKLSKYYLRNKNKEKALKHLLVLIAYGDDSASLYLQLGKLYLYDFGRPDKALYYYDEYSKRIPKTAEVEKEILRIQAVLANDLLVIVENEGAWNLWRDLARVIPDRLAVYYSMAEQLRKINKYKELREVLEIIHHHNPGDQEISLQLAQLAFSDNDYIGAEVALDALDEDHQAGSAYFFIRAKISENRSDFMKAISYYRSFLDSGVMDQAVILHCMQLAGTLGDMKQLQYFHTLSRREEIDKKFSVDTDMLYGKILFENVLYTKAHKFYSNLLKKTDLKESYSLLIQDRLVQILQKQERYFDAEQQLRLLLLKAPEKSKYLQLLVQNSLQARDWNSAWKWHEYREQENAQLVKEESDASIRLFIEKIDILSKSGQKDVAVEMAEDFLRIHSKSKDVQL